MQRQDYVQRLIEQLGVFFRQVYRARELGRTDEALISVVRAQETLFGGPAADYTQRSLEEQFAALTRGESERVACEKACAYAALLRSASEIYRDRGQDALADGAALFSKAMLQLAAEHFPSNVRPAMDRFAALQAQGGN